MSAASLVAIATGLSTRTTLITLTALAAVVTALALVGNFGIILAARFLLGAAVGLLIAASFMFLTALGQLATAFCLFTGCRFLTARAGTLLTGTALGIASTITGFFSTTAIFAGALFLLGTSAIWLIAALRSRMTTTLMAATTTCGLRTTKSCNILLDTS